MTAIFAFILKNPGLFIGLGIVIVATYFLPARMRWYVFTAGIAVIAFRTYQVIWANGRLKELDKEREQLRGELQGLRDKAASLEQEHERLRDEKDRIKQERDALLEERKSLDEKAADYEDKKKSIDERLEKKNQEMDSRHNEAKDVISFLESFAEAERLATNVPERI